MRCHSWLCFPRKHQTGTEPARHFRDFVIPDLGCAKGAKKPFDGGNLGTFEIEEAGTTGGELHHSPKKQSSCTAGSQSGIASSSQVVGSLPVPHQHRGGMHSPAGITSCETFAGVVLFSRMVNEAQNISLCGRPKTLPAIRFRQVLGHNFGVATFHNDSALFSLSYLAALVLSHLSPHAIEVAQLLDYVCHPGDLPEA